MAEIKMLTTIDNPFSPFDEFEEWNRFDQEKGYMTVSLLCRCMHAPEELSQEEKDYEMTKESERLARLNLLGNYKLVSKEVNYNNFY